MSTVVATHIAVDDYTLPMVLYKLYHPGFFKNPQYSLGLGGCILSFNRPFLEMFAQQLNQDMPSVLTTVVAVEPEPEPDLPSLKF